jgi:hypothetical protein
LIDKEQKMEDRFRSTIDGSIVGLVSGIALTALMSFWGISPTNEPSDLIFTCLTAGAMVGWVFEDGFRGFSFLGGVMTAFTAMFLMAIGALPFALFTKMLGGQAIVVNADETTTSALALILVAGIVGVIYSKLWSQNTEVASPTLLPQQLTIEN